MSGFVRVLLALAVCPALGAMLGRVYLGGLLSGPSADRLAWACGLALGLAFALALVRLVTSPRGSTNRAAGDLVLVALAALTLADIVAQISRSQMDWLVHFIGVIYALGFLLVLRRLRLPTPDRNMREA